MKPVCLFLAGFLILIALFSGCGRRANIDEAAAAPPAAKVETVADANTIEVSHADNFPLVAAGAHEEVPALNATCVVNPDVSREIPVVSLASGRVVDLRVQIGDYVTKGQLVLRVLSQDISQAFAEYNKAKADEALARKQLERSKLLYDHGAIALSEYEIAQDTEQKASVDVATAVQHLKTVGANPDREDPVVDIYAPVAGTIVDQQVTRNANVKSPDSQATALLTIADLTHIWLTCDVYENDLSAVRVGDSADVKLNAYPDRTFHGRISNIGTILDPNIRTAKVRIDLSNPGLMRIGMFATATFFGKRGETYATVPPTAVLHLHDRDWVFVPLGGGRFRRTVVTSGNLINAQTQLIRSGLSPGQQVVRNALSLSSASEEQ